MAQTFFDAVDAPLYCLERYSCSRGVLNSTLTRLRDESVHLLTFTEQMSVMHG